MKTTEQLEKMSSLIDLDSITLSDIMGNAHIIVGGNGRCMCGMYKTDGEQSPMHCSDIIQNSLTRSGILPNKNAKFPEFDKLSEGCDLNMCKN